MDQGTKQGTFVILTFVYRREGHRWTGECRELGTATFGRSLDQTHRELIDLVELHLETLDRVGERERFFRAHDIRLYGEAQLPAEVRAAVPVSDDGTFVQAHPVELRLTA